MQTSVKKRDQMKREAMAKQMKFLDFEKGMKHGTSPRHVIHILAFLSFHHFGRDVL